MIAWPPFVRLVESPDADAVSDPLGCKNKVQLASGCRCSLSGRVVGRYISRVAWKFVWPRLRLSSMRGLRANKPQPHRCSAIKYRPIPPRPVITALLAVTVEDIQIACGNDRDIAATIRDQLGQIREQSMGGGIGPHVVLIISGWPLPHRVHRGNRDDRLAIFHNVSDRQRPRTMDSDSMNSLFLYRKN